MTGVELSRFKPKKRPISALRLYQIRLVIDAHITTEIKNHLGFGKKDLNISKFFEYF
jgi:hypothetical protein